MSFWIQLGMVLSLLGYIFWKREAPQPPVSAFDIFYTQYFVTFLETLFLAFLLEIGDQVQWYAV